MMRLVDLFTRMALIHGSLPLRTAIFHLHMYLYELDFLESLEFSPSGCHRFCESAQSRESLEPELERVNIGSGG